jgi:hypothetical protein
MGLASLESVSVILDLTEIIAARAYVLFCALAKATTSTESAFANLAGREKNAISGTRSVKFLIALVTVTVRTGNASV